MVREKVEVAATKAAGGGGSWVPGGGYFSTYRETYLSNGWTITVNFGRIWVEFDAEDDGNVRFWLECRLGCQKGDLVSGIAFTELWQLCSRQGLPSGPKRSFHHQMQVIRRRMERRSAPCEA